MTTIATNPKIKRFIQIKNNQGQIEDDDDEKNNKSM